MRILHAYNLHRYRGGADNATLATVEMLQEAGVEVRSFAYSSQDMRPGLRGKLAAFCSGVYSPTARAAFARTLDTFAPDVVHAHKLYPLISPWVLPLCSERGIPVVMTIYDYQLTCPVGMHSRHGEECTRCLGGREYWGILRNCREHLTESVAYSLRHAVARHFHLYDGHVDRFVTPTDFAGRWLVAHAGVSPGNVVTIPYVFDAPDSAADPGAGKYVAYVGRFAPEKGLATLAGAARATGLPFELAGDAPALRDTADLANVRIVVTRSRAEVLNFYRGARMLVVPSTWFETFPMVIGEAMSRGIPVIASRIGGLPEIVEDGVTGLLFEPGDHRELAECIRSLWQDPERCRRLGAAAREKIMRTSQKDVVVQRLVDVYRQLQRREPARSAAHG
ncbi:MAG: glycosyltransferase family 4 protein [Gammaproteobacteria bacterium]|nr:glycosyltransferase family 4 protein [Gammaproteobacteria bacterium]MBI5616666.1 glycosyltransferase family 4 protein [Gammaproteobacteria bacterium]